MATVYPSLYRARAVQISGGSVVAFVPAVFGETAITISDFLGGVPIAPGMGWVLFQAGNPEFPVWTTGVSVGGGGGASGEDEVWVGPSDPGAGYELWYDTDALTPPDGGGGGTPGTIAYRHIQGTPASVWTVTHNLGFYPNVTVVDSSLSVVEGQIDYLTADTVRLTFSAAFSGEAYLS